MKYRSGIYIGHGSNTNLNSIQKTSTIQQIQPELASITPLIPCEHENMVGVIRAVNREFEALDAEAVGDIGYVPASALGLHRQSCWICRQCGSHQLAVKER